MNQVLLHFTKWAMEMTESNYFWLYIFILILAILGCVLIMQLELKLIVWMLDAQNEEECAMKQIDNVHILASPISDTIYVGTLKEQKKGFCISENKVDRTHEFLKALTDIYGNSSWRIKGDKKNFHCCVMDEETMKKNKDKTIGEFFKLDAQNMKKANQTKQENYAQG